ncbi:MAG: hypothetical protein AAGC74_12415 [Verrucomicrobiota bacterium]
MRLLCAIILSPLFANADEFFRHAPINYYDTPPNTPLTQLFARAQKDPSLLDAETNRDLLAQLLTHLHISPSSQVLVYSKTSAQNSRISPHTPRAIYFNQNTYLAYVQGGDLETITFDPQLGAVFHRIQHHNRSPQKNLPTLTHDHSCLSCHTDAAAGGSPTPSLLVRSVYPKANGLPELSWGSFRTDHRSPLAERWGGWYVTGSTGGQPHLGNRILKTKPKPHFTLLHQAPLQDLSPLFRTEPYLGGPRSDILALMILEHQLLVHNTLISAHLNARYLLHQNAIMRTNLAEPTEQLGEVYKRALSSYADHILDALLFKNEFLIPDDGPEGHPDYQKAFLSRAKRASNHRSLRDLQLYERLFKHRCSYLIHSDPFTHLPPLLKNLTLTKLHSILTHPGQHPDHPHLSQSERKKILTILTDTLPNFPPHER